jgi:thiamine-phosphate pyrophosphorylase
MTFGVPIICLVTDRQRLARPSDDELVCLAGRAAAAGVDLIQLRERNRDDGDLLALARRFVAAARGTTARVIVNDRLDIALAAGAAGVHLRADSVSAARVRAITPPEFIVGRSVHSAAEAVRAAPTGVDYLLMGTVYPSASKEGLAPIAGLAGLEAVCRAVSVPVLAIGGVATDKLRDIAGAGAAGVAAIGLFSEAVNENSHGDLEGALGVLVATIRRAFRPTGPLA